MSSQRSFTEFVAAKLYYEIFDDLERYVYKHRYSLNLRSNIILDVRYAKLAEFRVKSVSIDDRPGSRIAFDVIVEADIEVSGPGKWDYENDICSQWFIVECSGDLSQRLSDFNICNIDVYNQSLFHSNPLSDSLVPYIRSDKLEKTASDFLKKYYPEALKKPMSIDATELARRMGLKVVYQQLTSDFSIFGQIFFSDSETNIYDVQNKKTTMMQFNAGTIVVDPQTFLLRNLGSITNTIVHECVHWDKHQKAFELERLFNDDASQIKCIVVGGVKSKCERTATDWMEWQANELTPRIQMPIETFKVKVNELIDKYKQIRKTDRIIDVIEAVIDELSLFYLVSRHSAKIRMVTAGYEEAKGAFNYVDGRYIRPYTFKSGALQKNETYSISFKDAVVEMLWNQELREHTLNGYYVFVESHVCLNDKKYVEVNDEGNLQITTYAREHMDECCLAFNLKVKHKTRYSEQFYQECVLYRDVNTDLHFEAHFSESSNADVMSRARIIAQANAELIEVKKKLPMSFAESLIRIMEWADITEEKLAEQSKLSTKTIQRLRTSNDYNVTLRTVVAICIGMHLHPVLSQHLIEAAGLTFKYTSEEQMTYHFLVTAYYTHSIDECNELLQAQGYRILSNQE